MREPRRDAEGQAFFVWGCCFIGASVFWAAYFIGFGLVGLGERPTGLKLVLGLSAPLLIVGALAFQLGRRHARRRKESRARELEDPPPYQSSR